MDNPIYFAGNGCMAAGFQNGDLIQLFGPPYSSPSLFESRFIGDGFRRSIPRHLPRAAVWQIDFSENNRVFATVTDFVDSEENAIVRRIDTKRQLTLRFLPKEDLFDYCTVDKCDDGLRVLYKSKCGNYIYNDYPLPFPQFFTLLVKNAKSEALGRYGWDITVDGCADIIIAGGSSYPECDMTSNRILSLDFNTMLERTVNYWHGVFKEVTVMERVPSDFPYFKQLARAVEGTVISILTQQSVQGGVLAGYAYHLGYVRDQYGVCMGMLRLGLFRQARQMLCFYADVFKKSGKILNAQGMGVEGLFHFAENDETEITGYLLLQFFRYASVTGDWNLLLQNTELLQWLYEKQLSQLFDGTLPFNGDETYIAGGLLPRDVICDGSAEATMLFILSGNAYLEFLKKYNLINKNSEDRMRSVLNATESDYTSHFVKNNRYVLNDPTRAVQGELPLYRYGVCMNLGKDDCAFFGWTKRCDGGAYLCPKCMARRDIPIHKNELYDLPSALLMPAYLDAHLLPDELIIEYLNGLCEKIKAEGHFYSNEELKKNVGYDYGLLLYNLQYFGLDGRDEVCKILLSQIDSCGAWSEYYVSGEHSGTRYRPWESAINIDALIYFAQNSKV